MFLRDTTYLEGLVRLYKNHIALGLGDSLTYDLPKRNDDGTFESFEALNASLYAVQARPLPTGESVSIESLTRQYESSELEALPINISKS